MPAEQLLQAMLQGVDLAALLLQLLEELLALGAKQLDFLSKLAQFGERVTLRGHALSYAPTRAKFRRRAKKVEILTRCARSACGA